MKSFLDPTAIRANLMLQTAAFMSTESDWPFRQATIELQNQQGMPGVFRLFGANHPDSIQQVFDRQLDISILNPGVILTMAHQGVGLFSEPMQVATIAVLPHYDQLGFAVRKELGFTSLDDIRTQRYPLKMSTRGSADWCTTRLVEQVLRVHGFDYADIESWGGSVSYDQPMPNHVSRLGKARTGDIDAIFDEGVMVWANEVDEAGLHFLPIADHRLAELAKLGFRQGTIEQAHYPTLPTDVTTVDFSGWPIYTRIDTSDLLVRKFCEALEANKEQLPWQMGRLPQAPMPLARMVQESPETPLDVPFHNAARQYWYEQGYLS